VLTADPEIAGPGDWVGRRLGCFVGIFTFFGRAIEQPVEFALIETKQSEVDILIPERGQLRRKHFVVPAGVLGDPVIGNHQRAALSR
jgi:hypothetical protein